ncbi:DUF5941 domain-containing protein [Actinoplanes sp. HUAS TT8]|uniref:DUF5941 domain-containing protein n=1 Tax=Actinoplanes sp. HUAS TT8 TaxID=3447453 RepID=UPI003F51EE69
MDDLVTQHSLLRILATDPGGRSGVLLAADPAGEFRVDRGRVIAAEPGEFRYLGALFLATGDLPLLEKAAEQLTAYAKGKLIWPEADAGAEAETRTEAEVAAPADAAAGVGENGLEGVLLDALLEGGLAAVGVEARLLHAERVRTGEELAAARQRVAAIDEDKARLRSAVDEQDDFFLTYAVNSWSPLVTQAAARLGLRPAGVTMLSVATAGAAALAFWPGSRGGMILGGILVYLGLVLGCVEGQLARYTRRFGGRLEPIADRAKEYLVYAGLAAGADRLGLDHAWPLAIGAIVLQTVRDLVDRWYGVLRDEAGAGAGGGVEALRAAGAGADGRRTEDVGLAAAQDVGLGARLAAVRRGPLERIVAFPIGERWALIAVAAVLSNGRVALGVLVGFGALAFLGTLTLRALAGRGAVPNGVDAGRHRDDGWLARTVLARGRMDFPLIVGAVLVAYAVIGIFVGEPLRTGMLAGAIPAVLAAGMTARARHDRPLDWLVPAVLRGAEYLLVVLAGLVGGVSWPVVFGLLFVLALRHYDLTARMERGEARMAVLALEGRVVLLASAVLAGFANLGFVALTVVVGGTFLLTVARGRLTLLGPAPTKYP